jgi:hypothetical protein
VTTERADVDSRDSPSNSCCHGAWACIFTKALLARAAGCELATRQAVGETDVLVCSSPEAHAHCATLSDLLRERATFVLRLPRPPTPLMHGKALQLQCGGLSGLQQVLGEAHADVHRMVGLVHERHGSLLELPWQALVDAIAAWQPRRRHPGAGP